MGRGCCNVFMLFSGFGGVCYCIGVSMHVDHCFTCFGLLLCWFLFVLQFGLAL